MTWRIGLEFISRREELAHRVVPPSGLSAQLVVVAAGVMAFLAVFALSLSLASGRLAERWGSELAQSATIRIVAPVAQLPEQTSTALRILETTTGVAFARALNQNEQQALLAPWFGTDFDFENLPVPQLIEIIQEETGYDAEGLRLRLAAEVPGATLDDHRQWRAPLVRAANRLRALGALCVILLALTIGVMVTLAANVALAANEQVIRVLRLIGATDRYIERAFIRRFTIRAFAGALLGTGLGIGAVLLLPTAPENGDYLTGLGFRGGQWVWPLLIPVFTGGIAYLATGWSARHVLKELA